MNMKLIGAALLAATAATPAFAQDADLLSGLRAEVRAGYDHASLDVSYDDGTTAVSGSDGTDGIAYGGEIGYDQRVGGVVLGVYAGIDFASTGYCDELFGNDEACIEAGRNITVGARVGGAVGANALVYAKGGYSNGKIDVSYTDNAAPVNDFSDGDDIGGFHLGAGGQFGLGSNAYVKLEYVYTNYDGFEYSEPGLTASADLDRHQVLLGVGFRF